MKSPLETVDLSHLFGSPAREFRKEIRLGREMGLLIVLFNPPDSCYISAKYHPYRGFERTFPLKEVPARITRGLVRLGASDAYMRELQAADAAILAEGSGPVRHDQLHTDASEHEY